VRAAKAHNAGLVFFVKTFLIDPIMVAVFDRLTTPQLRRLSVCSELKDRVEVYLMKEGGVRAADVEAGVQVPVLRRLIAHHQGNGIQVRPTSKVTVTDTTIRRCQNGLLVTGKAKIGKSCSITACTGSGVYSIPFYAGVLAEDGRAKWSIV